MRNGSLESGLVQSGEEKVSSALAGLSAAIANLIT